MSLENIQVYRNFSNWRVCTVTLTNQMTSIHDLITEDDRQAIGGRPIARVDFCFQADDQTVLMSHAEDAGDEGTVTLFAAAGPGRWLGPPVINAHKKIYLQEGAISDQLKILVYVA